MREGKTWHAPGFKKQKKMKKYKKLKRIYYNIFKAERYYLISYGVKFPPKNFYPFRFLKRKAVEEKNNDYDLYIIDLI